MAANYLTTQVKSGSRIDENFLQTRLKPRRWTKEVLDLVMLRLVEEGLLLPRSGRLYEVSSLNISELDTLKKNCINPLAGIDDLYEACANTEDTRKRKDIMTALEGYAQGKDYTTAEGCEELVSYDEFGDPVIRWGYRPIASTPPPATPAIHAGSMTPVRRRKISISRLLINVDCSPSVASVMSLEEPSSHFRDDRAYNTDFSTADSEATVD